MADTGSKRKSFITVSQKDFGFQLTINNNESMFFKSKMGQIKHKPLRTRDFEHIFFFGKKIQGIEYCFVHQIIK